MAVKKKQRTAPTSIKPRSLVRVQKGPPQPTPRRSYTIDQWCAMRLISKRALYLLWEAGKGPGFYFNGRFRRIPDTADEAWIAAEQEAARTNTQAAINAERMRKVTAARKQEAAKKASRRKPAAAEQVAHAR